MYRKWFLCHDVILCLDWNGILLLHMPWPWNYTAKRISNGIEESPNFNSYVLKTLAYPVLPGLACPLALIVTLAVVYQAKFTGILSVLGFVSCLLTKWQIFIFDSVLKWLYLLSGIFSERRLLKRGMQMGRYRLFNSVVFQKRFFET